MHETTLESVFHFLHTKFLGFRFAKKGRVLQITLGSISVQFRISVSRLQKPCVFYTECNIGMKNFRNVVWDFTIDLYVTGN